MPDIPVDQSVIDYVKKNGGDYRVCTTCSGPVLLPVEMKPPKPSDIVIKVGEHTIYVSRVQARYVRKITADIIYDPEVGLSCSRYPGL